MSDPTSSDVHVNAPLGGSNKPRKKKNNLTNMLVKEISFCPAGMNPGAKIALFKRFNDIIDINECVGVGSMELSEIKKGLEEAKAENEALKKNQEAQAAELATMKQELEKAKGAFPPKKKTPPTPDGEAPEGNEPDADDMKKAAKLKEETFQKEFADLKKSNIEFQKQLGEEIQKRMDMELAKRADDELPHLAGTAAERGQLLKAAEALGEKHVAMLKSANEAMSKNFVEIGSGHSVAKMDAESQIETLAKNYQAANAGISYEKAYSQVLATTEGQKLYAKASETKK
jgi:hypothetical protein